MIAQYLLVFIFVNYELLNVLEQQVFNNRRGQPLKLSLKLNSTYSIIILVW